MIAVDIETTGVDMTRCGIWQIGAVEIENPENQFIQEARIDEEDNVINHPSAKRTVYEVTGKTEKEFRDKKKQSQKQMLENFFKWCKKIKSNTLVSHHPQFDYAFIQLKAIKYGLELPFSYRTFDLHTIAQIKYSEQKGGFLIEDGKSKMGMSKMFELCGMKDEREVAHNALEDAKLAAECFSRIVYGKNLLNEFKKFPVPAQLKK
jgi:DNA polymerase III epsilon subunit-like protein